MRIWSIPGTLVKGRREAVGLLIGGGMALLFGAIFTANGGSDLIQEYRFLTNSTTGVAEVVGKAQTARKNFFVDCHLLLDSTGKASYQCRIPVYSGLWQSLRKGQTLNVDYLRNDPSTMRLQGSTGDVGDSLLHVVIGSGLTVVAVVAITAATQFLVRKRNSADHPTGAETSD